MLLISISLITAYTCQMFSKDFHGASVSWSGEKAGQSKQQWNFSPTSPYHSGNCQLLWESLSLRSQWTQKKKKRFEEVEQNNFTGFSVCLNYNSKSQPGLFLITTGLIVGPPKCSLRQKEELGLFLNKFTETSTQGSRCCLFHASFSLKS